LIGRIGDEGFGSHERIVRHRQPSTQYRSALGPFPSAFPKIP
jgi:hypothetical protein